VARSASASATRSATCGPGGTWRILGDVPHEVTVGPDGAVVIDVFSPPREDWRAFPDRGRPADTVAGGAPRDDV
jgi:hypothetical protein